MAGKSKLVRKAEKASVRSSSSSRVNGPHNPKGTIKDLNKSSKANKAAGTRIYAGAVPGSVVDRKLSAKGTGGKRSSAKKTLAKRVNQSVIARGGRPLKTYVTKARAKEIEKRAAMAKTSPMKKTAMITDKQDSMKKSKLDGKGGYN